MEAVKKIFREKKIFKYYFWKTAHTFLPFLSPSSLETFELWSALNTINCHGNYRIFCRIWSTFSAQVSSLLSTKTLNNGLFLFLLWKDRFLLSLPLPFELLLPMARALIVGACNQVSGKLGKRKSIIWIAALLMLPVGSRCPHLCFSNDLLFTNFIQHH